MHQLLIDTDPGVDDALAILMAHAHPGARVVALTTTAGNVGLEHTTANALKLLDVIGVDTPVYAGCATPLVRPAEDAAFVHGRDGFGDIGYQPSTRTAEREHAAQAIVRLTRERAGELTLVMLGPLTNLALALHLDPSLPQRVRRLVVMGGAVTGRGNTALIPAEFNVSFDPEAAHLVFSRWPMLELIDWEATVAHGIDFASFSKWLDAPDPRARFYREISRKTLEFVHDRGRPRMLSADALAMTAVLEPDAVAESAERHVAIELDGRLTRGATVVDWDRRGGGAANARIALRLSQARFERLAAAALGAG